MNVELGGQLWGGSFWSGSLGTQEHTNRLRPQPPPHPHTAGSGGEGGDMIVVGPSQNRPSQCLSGFLRQREARVSVASFGHRHHHHHPAIIIIITIARHRHHHQQRAPSSTSPSSSCQAQRRIRHHHRRRQHPRSATQDAECVGVAVAEGGGRRRS